MSHHYSGPDWGFPRGDARLDLTDLYAFPKPGDSDKSILIMNVHPSPGEYPPGPTTPEPFAAEALYEIKADTNADAVADIAYRVRFSSLASGAQTATLRRVEGEQARGMSDGGSLILEGAPVSTGREALVTEAGDYRLFAGWRSDPFFFDRRGALNNLQFTGADFFADKDVCGIVLEVPNSALQSKKRLGYGIARWYGRTARVAVGSRRSAAHTLFLSFSSSVLATRRKSPTSQATRWMMRVSSQVSHTRWSTRVGIRRRKQHGWQRHCCRKSCLTTPRVPLPFPTMAGHSPTMPQMSS